MLICVLASLKLWIERNTQLEQRGSNQSTLQSKSTMITINPVPKDQATLEHKALLRTIDLNHSVIAYTDRSLLKGNAGSGIYIHGNGLQVKLAAFFSDKCEVFDADIREKSIWIQWIQVDSVDSIRI